LIDTCKRYRTSFQFFEGNRLKDKQKIKKLKLTVSSDLEILPYRSQDFDTDDPFVKEIMETGIVLI